jgi:hypothetical protein
MADNGYSRKITLQDNYDAYDLELGYRRMRLDTEAHWSGDAGERRKLIDLWLGFIAQHDAVYTVDAIAFSSYMSGLGTDAEWNDFAQYYIDCGIKYALRALDAGIPVADIIGLQ